MSHENVIVLPTRRPENALRRPALLIRAAKEGQRFWRRTRDLPRLLRLDCAPSTARAMTLLQLEEERLDGLRRANAAEYDMQRHIACLIALLAEMNAARNELRAPIARSA